MLPRRNENEFVHLALVSNLRLSLKHERVVIVQWQKKFDVDGRRIRECLNESRAVEEGGRRGAEPPLQFQGGLSPPSTFYKQYIPQLKGLFQK